MIWIDLKYNKIINNNVCHETELLFLQVVITDLGELGENAIVVFEEAVGVGAEETVIGGVDDLDSVYLESDSDVLQVWICLSIYFDI